MDCQLKGLSKFTVKSYRIKTRMLLKYVQEEFKINRVSKIKSNHIKSYIAQKISNGNTEIYLNGIIKVLKVFFNYCVKEEYTVKSPMEKVNLLKHEQKIIETFTLEEVQSMINSYDYSDYFNSRNKTILSLLFETGIRSMDCINIKNDDIYTDRILIRGKGNKQRFVPISSILKKTMKKYEKMKGIYFYKKDNLGENYFP